MTRFNYAPARAERLRSSLQVPLATLAALVLSAGATAGIEGRRAADLAARLHAVPPVDASAPPATVLARTAREIATLRTTLAGIDGARRHADDQANELAILANRIPPGSWLLALHAAGAAWTLDGRARDVDDVRATLAGLRAAGPHSAPRLLVLEREPTRRTLRYTIAWENAR